MPFVRPPGQTAISRARGCRYRRSRFRRPSIFLFDTPILFQNTPIGTIHLGVSQAGMQHVLQATLALLAFVGLVTVVAVGSLSYFSVG